MKGKKGPASRAASQELFALMFELGRILKSEIVREGCPLPSFLHAETLRYIADEAQPTMRDIAAYLKVTPPTATALVDSFVTDKIVERVQDSTDRRKVRLVLSKKGTKLLAQLQQQRTEAFARVFEPLSKEDRHEFARLLTIITRSNLT